MGTSARRTLSGLRSSERFDRPAVREAYELTRGRFGLAKTIRLRREEMGWSQTERGPRAEMPRSGMARFERGGAQPALPPLERLADARGPVLRVCVNRPGSASADSVV